MTRGSAYQHIILRDQGGTQIQDPFLELPEELWDAGMTRLTVLLDPGRIKRGLLPNELVGSVFEEGQEYTLTISSAWMDASGQALGAPFEKKFRAGPADYLQPDPANWTCNVPAPDSREPLGLEFPESLDAALVSRLITVRDQSGVEVAGDLSLAQNERSWSFRPDQKWKRSPYRLHIDHRIEDLAGNSIGRRFEEALDRHPEALGDQPGHTVRQFTPGHPASPAK
jgi:hypothetical protein